MFHPLARLALRALIPLSALSAAQAAAPTAAQLPDFTYQGRLERDGQLVDGAADLEFTLWDASVGGAQIGSAIVENGYPVSGGLFSIHLAFPGAFTGEQRYLQVRVDGNALPRQPIATAPVAQYALSGTPGPAGTTGQSATTVYGTGQLTVGASTTSYTLIPGLRQTVDVPSNSRVFITTDGGAQHALTGSTYSVVDVAIFVDGATTPSAGQRRLVLSNTPAVANVIGNWSMSLSQSLPAGPHTIEVRAKNGETATANVSSGSAPQMQGQLTVMVIRY